MSKSGKNNNFNIENEKSDKMNYKNYPFNSILILYIDFKVNQLKKNVRKKEGRNSFKSDVYDELEKETGVAYETIKNYYLGKSTLPKNSNLYEKFAKVFKCNVIDILPDEMISESNRIKIAEDIGIDINSYRKLRAKKIIHLWKTSELDRTYYIILNSIIQQDDFLTTYENEVDDDLKKLFEKIKTYKNYKNMEYNELLLYMQTNEPEDYQILENIKSKIQNALLKQTDGFVKIMFEKELRKGE